MRRALDFHWRLAASKDVHGWLATVGHIPLSAAVAGQQEELAVLFYRELIVPNVALSG
jgi:hypothetical protein